IDVSPCTTTITCLILWMPAGITYVGFGSPPAGPWPRDGELHPSSSPVITTPALARATAVRRTRTICIHACSRPAMTAATQSPGSASQGVRMPAGDGQRMLGRSRYAPAAWRRIAAATHPDGADGGDPARVAAAAAAYTELRTRYGRGEACADLTTGNSREPR